MTEADLLRRVCLDPAGDLPRLLYADWCDETGQHDRAEFIRVQMEVSKAKSAGGKWSGTVFNAGDSCECRTCCLRRRERELLSGSLSLWFRGKDFPQTAEYVDADRYKRHTTKKSPAPIVAVLWLRGFVESVTCTAAQWLTHGPAIVRQQPITRVAISDAVIHPSGGNSTYYVGGLGRFPSKYWRSMENLPSRATANDALNTVALLWARQEAGLEVTV